MGRSGAFYLHHAQLSIYCHLDEIHSVSETTGYHLGHITQAECDSEV